MFEEVSIDVLWSMRREYQEKLRVNKSILEVFYEEAERMESEDGVVGVTLARDISATEARVRLFRTKIKLTTDRIREKVRDARETRRHKHIPHYGMFA